jgi:hypothetical protein
MSKKLGTKFWPYPPQTSIIFTIILLIGLLAILIVLRVSVNWPGVASENTVFLGILLISSLPILLSLIDAIIERGGVIEYGGVKIDFSKGSIGGAPGLTVPVNIGVPGQPLTDSSSSQILDALRKATASDLVVIDLEEGKAWWETRLLVLLAGAVRLGKPKRVVFIGKVGGIEQHFEGWGRTDELLQCLLKAHCQYSLSYHKAMAAGRQWALVEPVGSRNSPAKPEWMQQGLAAQHYGIVFDYSSGLPKDLMVEQLLQSDLGSVLESKEDERREISLSRLDELFKPVLHKDTLDENWSPKKQIETFFASECEFIAVTQNSRYKLLVSRSMILDAMMKQLVLG